MSPVDDQDRGLGGDDALAAEYVLGVLSAEDRQAASRRIDTDPSFASLVDAWELRLSPMADAYTPVDPPAGLKQAIDRRLFAPAAGRTPGILSSLALWRGLTAAALAALALTVVVPRHGPPAPPSPVERLIASLAAEGSDVRYVALFDGAANKVGLSHLSGARAEGHDFELWVIEGDNPPRSLGVIPVGATVDMPMPDDMREKVADGAVFAITLEPAGGSTTGGPTGPVVAEGELRDI